MLKVNKWMRVCIGILLCSCILQGVFAHSLSEQRERYKQLKLAWDKNQQQNVDSLMPTLVNYPLYPYLEYRLLMENLGTISPQMARNFVKHYADFPFIRNFTTAFVEELGRREDWQGLLSFSPEAPDNLSAKCYFYYAKSAVGKVAEAWKGTKNVWLSAQFLPANCGSLIEIWIQAGELTTSSILDRIVLAYEKKNTSLVAFLVKQLPAEQQEIGDAVLKLQQDPTFVLAFSERISPSTFSHQMIFTAFQRLAKRDVDQASQLLSRIVHIQDMSREEQIFLEKTLAWNLMTTNITSRQAQWRDEVIKHSGDEALIERRIRLALSTEGRGDLAAWLNLLPENIKGKDEWVYWRAIVLEQEGKQAKSQSLLRNLAEKRGFYPMVAAQKLGITYPIKVKATARVPISEVQWSAISRIHELLYWNNTGLAMLEWKSLLERSSSAQQASLARYAFEQNWAAFSVQATIVAKLWDHLEERFPLAWKTSFKVAAQKNGIPQAYAMAIARQESAWDPTARSSAGALGLMQVMPATAKHTVKMFGIQNYKSSQQLYEPKMNILVGTHYLRYVYKLFGHNRILASAAYNAGPSRVKVWLQQSGGRLDPIAFIESIPYNETRGYVKNVLAYDLFYRYFLRYPEKQGLKILEHSEWEQWY